MRSGFLSRDLNEEKEPVGQRSGEEHSHQGDPMQRLE